MAPLPVEAYQVGVLCALPKEMTAARAMLDEEHEGLQTTDWPESNNYVLGRVHQHNVVIACLPAGLYGTNAAGTVAIHMLRTFPAIRFGLMVGIGGGVPNFANEVDIRLGDVVVSQPDATHGGVVQYDLGKNLGRGKFKRKGFLDKPPTVLLTALASIQSKSGASRRHISETVSAMIQKPDLADEDYMFPGVDQDHLYCTWCDRSQWQPWWWMIWVLLFWLNPLWSCNLCDNGKIPRSPNRRSLKIHYGTIASGNSLIKNAAERDRLGNKYGAKCIEMEAAGLMNEFPCIVVRGICDYADSHKNDVWQKYAAVTAAAFAKELLSTVKPTAVHAMQRATEITSILTGHAQDAREHYRRQEAHNQRQEDHYSRQETQYQNDRHRHCHRIFKTSAYEEHKNFNSNRVPGTCHWVLDHPKFQEWRDSPHSDLLWISADPGCGKSVLSKSLIDHDLRNTTITTTATSRALHSICYFFFKDNEVQHNLTTALCALLHQLFAQQPQLIRHAVPAWQKDGEKIQNEVDGLWRILHTAANDPEARPIICVLDALDECREKGRDRQRLVALLCRFYKESRKTSSVHSWLKFVVTSRPYDDIQDGFQQIPPSMPLIRLRGEDENDQIHREIDLVVRERVAEIARDLHLMPQTKERIEQTLLRMDHRTYLWLHLAIGGIRTTFRDSMRPDEESIDTLPVSVEEAYEQILNRVTEKQKSIVKTILLIVVGARRALTIEELSLALGITTSPLLLESLANLNISKDHLGRHIQQWCGLFIFVNHSRVYLIHQTAKEFLLSSNGQEAFQSGRWKHFLAPTDVELEMARICISYVCLAKSGPLDSLNNEQKRFYRYCAEHWPSHFNDQAVGEDEILLSKVLSLYDTKSDLFSAWFPIMWRALMPFAEIPNLSDQHIVAFNGHAIVLKRLYQSRCFALEAPDGTGKTALYWAAERGNQAVVKWLVDNGAEVNAQGGGNHGNALYAASERGYEEVVQILVDKGADVNAQGGGNYGNALYAASLRGHEKVVQILVDKGADVNTRGGRGGNALQAASERGHEKVVRMLVDAGADVNAKGWSYGNALQAASSGGHEKVVQILIDAGADVHAEGGYYGNALQAASSDGHEKIVRMLVGAGADVNAQGGRYGNALQAASKGGHEKVVRILVDSGADVNAQAGERYYGNALQAASSGGHEKVVRMLVDAGADVNAQGGRYGNALQAASSGGHEKVAWMLVDAGADVNAQGGRYGNALQAASEAGHEKVVRMLVNSGADVHAQGGRYGNVLYAASDRGHEKIVQILVDAGADVNAEGRGYYSGNALQAASAGGHEKVVQIAVDAGADFNARGGDYAKALYAASLHGHGKVVQMLVVSGADVNAEGGRYGNALQAASARGHEKVVQILVDADADVHAQGGFYGNALQAASEGGHEKVVRILLDAGADVHAEGGLYGNALQAASAGGHEKVVQILLDSGADVHAEGGRYGNALQAASGDGHEKVVQILLDKGADVHAEGGLYGNALQAASSRGHEQVVQILMDAGADVNARGGVYDSNALYTASVGGHEQVVHILLDAGADVNTRGGEYGNALQAASVGDHEKVVQILLDAGADINARGGVYDSNALQAASAGGHEKVVQILVAAGADVNARGGLYGNALYAASLPGHEKVVQILLDAGADVNARQGEYGNALQVASSRGHEKVVQILLDAGADVNARGGAYGNALCAASERGREKVVQILVDAGADVNARGGAYGNALYAASLLGHEKVVQMLVNSGADVHAHGRAYGNALQAAFERGDENR